MSLAGQERWMGPLQTLMPVRPRVVAGKGDGSSTMAGVKDSIIQGTKEGAESTLRSAPEHVATPIPPNEPREPIHGPSMPPAVDPASPNQPTDPMAVQEGQPIDQPGYAYRPDGRRDPFLAIVQDANKAVEVNLSVPPLQRVNLSEVTLIGVVWGGFGYIAMVQTPDGRGYTVREGTRIGSSDGLVSSITAEGLTIKEPFSDIFGRKEMREQIIPLHPRVNVE